MGELGSLKERKLVCIFFFKVQRKTLKGSKNQLKKKRINMAREEINIPFVFGT
jgi:hypothetical protein